MQFYQVINNQSAHLHGSDCGLPEFSVIFNWNIPSLLKLKARIHSQLLPCRLPEGFGPLGLAWVLLLLEVLMTFGSGVT